MALRHRQLSYGFPVPQDFLDALQEFIGPGLHNLRLLIFNPTTLEIPAGPTDQVSVGVQGRWRWITAAITAAHPAGPPGQYDVYVTATENAFVLGGPSGETDNTDYAVGLVIRVQGSPPATPLYRKIAETTWSGSAITAVTMTQGSTPPNPIESGIGRGAAILLGGGS